MDEDEKPIGELFGKLIDDGKAYAKAEAELVKARAEARANLLKKPAILLTSALLFVVAAAVVLIGTLAVGLATLTGPVAGGLIAVGVALAVAVALAMIAKASLEPRP